MVEEKVLIEWKTNIIVPMYKNKDDKLVSQLQWNNIIMRGIQNTNHSYQQQTS
jgi:hypothetical protein